MNLAQLDLNLLVALDALLREQNVTRAGSQVGMSQPAMSAALSRLRVLFEDELLVRVGRTYYLTPLGGELAAPVADILHRIRETVERRPAFNPATDERHFIAAASDYVSWVVLDRLLPVLATEAPNLTLELMGTEQSPAPKLASGDLDFAFLPGPTSLVTQFPHDLLFEDRWICAVSKDNEEIGDRMTAEQFHSLPHLVFRQRQQSSLLDRALLAVGVERTVQVSLSNFLLLPLLLHRTPYVIIVYERLARRLEPLTRIRLLEPPFPLPKIPVRLYWPRQRSSDPAHIWMRNKIRELCSDLKP
ncbi:MAG: LysR family transcriptional regulator [Dehalococcoidia bacterium]|nr:LysR family transcriptional regulator [Dehalococcoidia bacterium]